MISSAALPSWPLHGRHLGFGFRRLDDKHLGRFIPIFLWLIRGDWSKVPVDNQLRRSSKMAKSVDFLTNAWPG
jgi:hypothetical protein